MYLTTEKKKEIFKKYGSSETNTGSTEGQITKTLIPKDRL